MSYQPPVAPAQQHPRAMTSLVLGILSLLCLGFLSGIPAMVIGRRATREIRESRGALAGDGVATAGFITGLIGTVLSAMAALLLVGVMVLAVAGGSVIKEGFESTCTQIDDSGQTTSCAD